MKGGVMEQELINMPNNEIYSGENDITDYLDIPAAVDGVVSISGATVKDEFVKEPLDTEKGAEIELSSDEVCLKTAPTRKGLFYQLKEGETLGEIAKKYYGRKSAWRKIQDANKTIVPQDGKVRAGDELTIP